MLLLLVSLLTSSAALTGKTVGRTIDDPVMAAEVKTKLTPAPVAVPLSKLAEEPTPGTGSRHRNSRSHN